MERETKDLNFTSFEFDSFLVDLNKKTLLNWRVFYNLKTDFYLNKNHGF